MLLTNEAECWFGCTDPECPYSHATTYRVREEDTGAIVGPFYSLFDAEQHDRAHSKAREA